MKWKYILGFIVITILIIYIIFYPLRFEFYEDIKAKQIADYIVIPIFIILVFYDLFRNIKKGETNWKKYIIDCFKGTALCSVFYFLLLRRFLSYVLIIINSIFGEVETVTVSGIIIEKVDIKGSGKAISDYKIIIKQKETDVIFDTRLDILNNYTIGQHVTIEMKKGILNLIYK
ncbi:hypothetical protein [Olleya namhaensis]|uniref:hypothetical protein n=1 Tax=Olleya namhaensis TaxID=1144750 RepID=UPI002490C80E|nr:hypothetical protein [Olleya namhaensis]